MKIKLGITSGKKWSTELKVLMLLAMALLVLCFVTITRYPDLFRNNSQESAKTENQPAAEDSQPKLEEQKKDDVQQEIQEEQPPVTPEEAPAPVAPVEPEAPEAPSQPGAPTEPREEDDAETNTDTDKTQPAQPSTEVYRHTAVAGDSYTAVARAAIAQVAAAKGIVLSAAERLQAEVTLVNQAGSPLLEVGQVVEIKIADVATVLGVDVAETSTQTDTADDTDNEQTPDENTNPAQSDVVQQVAAGDSYTLLARHAVSKTLQNQNRSLTPAQKIAAETFLTSAAGFPLLSVGQVVTIAHSDLQSALDKAAGLNAQQQAAWQAYAVHVAM